MLGFYNVIKPTGVSSSYVVNKLKHVLDVKVGHLGTLDPLASGVLPVAVGKATRLFDYFLKKEKKYFALAKLGVSTETLDPEGRIVERVDKVVTLKEIENVAKSLLGESMQYPPLYSARSSNGIRGYEAAVKNIDIRFEPKKVQIYSISVNKWHQNDVFALNIHCSAGTYVRAIVRDIAKLLGTVATTVAIIRTKSGAFDIESAVTHEEIEEAPEKHLIKLNDVLKMREIVLEKQDAKFLVDGKSIKLNVEDGEYLTFYEGQEFSLVSVKDGFAKNDIYFYDKDVLW